MTPIMSSNKTALGKLSSPTFCLNLTAFLVVLTLAVLGAEGSQPQFGRNVDNKQRTAPSCFNSFSNCWNIPECRNAYRGLKKRCKVIGGHCSASMVDLPRCAQIMDTLFANAFTKSECRCDRDKKRCFELRNNIYHNHCFDKAKIVSQRELRKHYSSAVRQTTSLDLLDGAGTSSTAKTVDKREYVTMSGEQPVSSGHSDRTDDASINHLRANNMFPSDVTAFDKASGYNPLNSTAIPMEAETQVINGGVGFDDYIFGDEGFADPLSSKDGQSPLKHLKDILNRIEDSNAMDYGINYPANNEQLDLFSDPAKHTKGSNKTTGPNRKIELGDKLDFSNDSANEYLVEDPDYNKNKNYTEKHLREESTNFKVIAIILGCLLGVFIVMAITFFAWLRLHGSYFYTSGKVVRDHRKQEGIHHNQPANHHDHDNGKLQGMA